MMYSKKSPALSFFKLSPAIGKVTSASQASQPKSHHPIDTSDSLSAHSSTQHESHATLLLVSFKLSLSLPSFPALRLQKQQTDSSPPVRAPAQPSMVRAGSDHEQRRFMCLQRSEHAVCAEATSVLSRETREVLHVLYTIGTWRRKRRCEERNRVTVRQAGGKMNKCLLEVGGEVSGRKQRTRRCSKSRCETAGDRGAW